MSYSKVFKLNTLTTLFSLFYLTACEQGPQTIEESYLNEVEQYSKDVQDSLSLNSSIDSPPFLKSTNSQLNEIRSFFYEENNDVLDLSCQENIQKNGQTLPKIKIVAESHNCPNCILDFSKNLIKGRKGEIILAIEGCAINTAIPIELAERGNLPPLLNNLPTSKQLAFGIDSNSSISGLTLVVKTLNIQSKLSSEKDKNEFLDLNPAMLYKMNNYEGEVTTAIFNSFQDLFRDPERDEVLEMISQEKPLLAKKIATLLANFSQNYESASDREQKNIAQINLLNKTLTFNSLYELMEKVLELKIRLFVKKNKNMSSKKIIDFLSSNLDLSDKNNLDTINELFLVDLRNKEFSQNISKIYCNLSLPNQKDLTVILGAIHASSQKYLLEKMFADLKVKPIIEVDTIESKHKSWTIPQRKKDVTESLKEIQDYKQTEIN